jgi:hypothetical protein
MSDKFYKTKNYLKKKNVQLCKSDGTFKLTNWQVLFQLHQMSSEQHLEKSESLRKLLFSLSLSLTAIIGGKKKRETNKN